MTALWSSIVLAALLPVVVRKGHAETVYERNERHETARKLKIYPEARLSYYIRDNLRNETDFVKRIYAAANMITADKCVDVVEVNWLPDLIFERKSSLLEEFLDGEYCQESGTTGYRVYFAPPFPDMWTVLRTFLTCLAPLKFEFQRRDRDNYVYINWASITPGKHYLFSKLEDYPPDIPGFSKDYYHGNLVSRDLYAFSMNGAMTIIPKYRENFEYYYSWRYDVDFSRLKSFYKQLKFPTPYDGYFYSYVMKPRKSCTE